MKFTLGLLVVLRVIMQLLPFIKRVAEEYKPTLSSWRSKYKGVKIFARFFYRRGVGKGQRQGRQQERAHIARRLLKLGVDPATVRKATGLTRRELQQLSVSD